MPRRHAIGAALSALLLLALLTPIRRELFVGDETKYGEVIREMRATGSWLLPPLEGAPFTHKPPLHFWLIGILTLPLGTRSIWAFVIPSLAAFAFLIWLMRRAWGPMAAFICGSSLLVWASAQSARMDVGFTALITLGVWWMSEALDGDNARRMILAGASLGVAALVKGPMSVVIGVVLYALESWRRRRRPRWSDFLAALVAGIIPLLWFVPAMLRGGGHYAQEVLQKQLAGRAVSAWVHQSPPWFYLLHAPADLFPWFFAAVAAIWLRWREERFAINWLLAVLVPYSLMSSKLDVYMMALVPPVAIIIAGAAESAAVRRANLAMLCVLALLAVAVFVSSPVARIRGPERALVDPRSVTVLVGLLFATAAMGFVVGWRGGAVPAILALGFTPIIVIAWIALSLMPVVDELATTRPLVRALAAQAVPAERIALYTCPHLWTREMPDSLERVRYVSAATLDVRTVDVVATSRAHAAEIAPQLVALHRVDSVRMIGKWFDVYRR